MLLQDGGSGVEPVISSDHAGGINGYKEDSREFDPLTQVLIPPYL